MKRSALATALALVSLEVGGSVPTFKLPEDEERKVCFNKDCSNPRKSRNKLFCSAECKREHDESVKVKEMAADILRNKQMLRQLGAWPYQPATADDYNDWVPVMLRALYKRYRKVIGFDALERGHAALTLAMHMAEEE